MGEFGNQAEPGQRNSLYARAGAWFTGSVATSSGDVPTDSTFVAAAARIICHRLPANKEHEFWIAHTSPINIYGGSYAYAI